MKRCSRCKSTKPLEEFPNNKSMDDGRNPYCKVCTYEYQKQRRDRDPEILAKRAAAAAARTPEARRDFHLRRAHKITLQQYKEMYSAQEGKCKICQTKEEDELKLQVDHDHKCCPTKAWSCGKCIRGLLCAKCNRGLSFFNDDPALFSAAIKYITGTKIF